MLPSNFNTISLHRRISYYLLFSYLYYEENKSIVDDDTFDSLCKNLLENFKALKKSKHQHKNLITEENLKCGTGFGIKFPNIVKHSAESLLATLKESN